MPQPQPATNQILAALPSDEFERLARDLQPIDLPTRMDLYERSNPVEFVYFLHRGVVSMTTPFDNGTSVEIATIGPEGMVGIPVFLGADRMPSNAFVQVAGHGVRLSADAFRRIIAMCPSLNHLLLRYTLALMDQMAQTAACNRTHAIEERCARWLLMTHDRVYANEFPLTQEFLAQMLGVRRPSVSIAAGMLAKAGLISYVRGRITIIDREGLEAAACNCYHIIADEFRRLVGKPG
ncbi:MAG TPA: Crp/Fnr family transcriptional regulator [Stellaceae bacterium]|nr:Crp/Fnr family transcriptional regulator [Stellaceae bacterium]